MEISQNELVLALDRAQNAGASTPDQLAGFVFGYLSAAHEFAESGGAVADAPEDPTPRRGDMVRVVAGLVDHEKCEGHTGELEGPDVGGDYYAGGHYGALSDFEKIT